MFPHNIKDLNAKLRTGSARHDYGLQLAEMTNWNGECAYCTRDLISTYESWLHLQVDHVIPRYLAKHNYKSVKKWIESIPNCVICCAACNAFLNKFEVDADPPKTADDFFSIRNQIFTKKKNQATERHKKECEMYKEKWALGRKGYHGGKPPLC